MCLSVILAEVSIVALVRAGFSRGMDPGLVRQFSQMNGDVEEFVGRAPSVTALGPPVQSSNSPMIITLMSFRAHSRDHE